MWYVYELRNEFNEIVWVGESIRPSKRLLQHTSKNGKFTNEKLNMTIVAEFDNRKKAWYHQVQLQNQYNLETDLAKTKRAGSIKSEAKLINLQNISTFESRQKGGFNNKGNTYNIQTKTCPYCNLVGKGSNMTRYHFNNCKYK